MNKNSPLTKEIILGFMKRNENQKYTIHKLFVAMKEEFKDKHNVNYSTVSKWVEVLIALNKIKHEDFDSIKVVWYAKE